MRGPAKEARRSVTRAEANVSFNQGVDHYARREFVQARQSFQKILDGFPNDVAAKNALRRVDVELR